MRGSGSMGVWVLVRRVVARRSARRVIGDLLREALG